MKQKPCTIRRACDLLLAAAALPLTPLYAQATAPADATPPTVDAPPPVVAPASPAATTPAPVPTMEPIVHTAPTADAAAPASDAAPVRARASAPTRTVTRTRTVAPAEPAPSATAPAPAPTPAFETPVTPVAAAPEPLPAPPLVTPPPVIPDNGQNNLVRIVPWIAGGLILLGLIALLLVRRRRRTETAVYTESVYDEPTPVAAPEPMIAAPIAAEANAAAFEGTVATDPVGAPPEPSVLNRRIDQPAGATMGQSLSAMVGIPAAPAATAATAATAAATGRPSLDISMRPVRAGVQDDDAVVEFELTVDNTGSASAHDVRVSAWMFPAGSDRGSEMECMLIGDRAETKLADVEPGDAQKIESSVALSTEHVKEDSLLPVVAAEARYRLADGSEQRTTARFAVGVPMGGELAHFDVENPSGLHEGVEAIPIEQLERA
ncbi:MAG: hypothetical protein ACM3YM_05690 [Sphingomonadales bacterium]